MFPPAADGVSLQTMNKKEEGEFADDKEEEDNVAPVEVRDVTL